MGQCCGCAKLPPVGVASAHVEAEDPDTVRELLDRWRPIDVEIMRRRYEEAKGSNRYLNKTAFRSVFELRDMPQEAVDAAFRVFDLDGSGDIDFREFCWALSVCFLSGEVDRLRFVFDLFDFNGDGVLSVQVRGNIPPFSRRAHLLLGRHPSSPPARLDDPFPQETRSLLSAARRSLQQFHHEDVEENESTDAWLDQQLELISGGNPDTVIPFETFVQWAKERDDVRSILSVFEVVPTKEKELDKVIEHLENAPWHPGAVYYVVSGQWWEQWRRYTQWDDFFPPQWTDPKGGVESNHSDQVRQGVPPTPPPAGTNSSSAVTPRLPDASPALRNRDSLPRTFSSGGLRQAGTVWGSRPGAIDNSDLVQLNDESAPNAATELGSSVPDGGDLQTNLVPHTDFVLWPESLWKEMTAWYGADYALARYVVPASSALGTAMAEEVARSGSFHEPSPSSTPTSARLRVELYPEVVTSFLSGPFGRHIPSTAVRLRVSRLLPLRALHNLVRETMGWAPRRNPASDGIAVEDRRDPLGDAAQLYVASSDVGSPPASPDMRPVPAGGVSRSRAAVQSLGAVTARGKQPPRESRRVSTPNLRDQHGADVLALQSDEASSHGASHGFAVEERSSSTASFSTTAARALTAGEALAVIRRDVRLNHAPGPGIDRLAGSTTTSRLWAREVSGGSWQLLDPPPPLSMWEGEIDDDSDSDVGAATGMDLLTELGGWFFSLDGTGGDLLGGSDDERASGDDADAEDSGDDEGHPSANERDNDVGATGRGSRDSVDHGDNFVVPGVKRHRRSHADVRQPRKKRGSRKRGRVALLGSRSGLLFPRPHHTLEALGIGSGWELLLEVARVRSEPRTELPNALLPLEEQGSAKAGTTPTDNKASPKRKGKSPNRGRNSIAEGDVPLWRRMLGLGEAAEAAPELPVGGHRRWAWPRLGLEDVRLFESLAEGIYLDTMDANMKWRGGVVRYRAIPPPRTGPRLPEQPRAPDSAHVRIHFVGFKPQHDDYYPLWPFPSASLKSSGTTLFSGEQPEHGPLTRWTGAWSEWIARRPGLPAIHAAGAKRAASARTRLLPRRLREPPSPSKLGVDAPYGDTEVDTSGSLPPADPPEWTCLSAWYPSVTEMSNFGGGQRRGGVSMAGAPLVKGGTGLANLGNSCYMNSVLQCISHTPLLREYLSENAYRVELNRRNPRGSGGAMADSLAHVLRELWRGKYAVYAPRPFRSTVSRVLPMFAGLEQQDAHEILQAILSLLHEDLNRAPMRPDPADLPPEIPEGLENEVDEGNAAEKLRPVSVALAERGFVDRGLPTSLKTPHAGRRAQRSMDLSAKEALGLHCAGGDETEMPTAKGDASHQPGLSTGSPTVTIEGQATASETPWGTRVGRAGSVSLLQVPSVSEEEQSDSESRLHGQTNGQLEPQKTDAESHSSALDKDDNTAMMITGAGEVEPPPWKLHLSVNQVHVMLAARAWAVHLAQNRSVIADIFHGMSHRRTACVRCRHSSTVFQAFSNLTLPMPSHGARPVYVTVLPLSAAFGGRRAMAASLAAQRGVRPSAMMRQLQSAVGFRGYPQDNHLPVQVGVMMRSSHSADDLLLKLQQAGRIRAGAVAQDRRENALNPYALVEAYRHTLQVYPSRNWSAPLQPLDREDESWWLVEAPFCFDEVAGHPPPPYRIPARKEIVSMCTDDTLTSLALPLDVGARVDAFDGVTWRRATVCGRRRRSGSREASRGSHEPSRWPRMRRRSHDSEAPADDDLSSDEVCVVFDYDEDGPTAVEDVADDDTALDVGPRGVWLSESSQVLRPFGSQSPADSNGDAAARGDQGGLVMIQVLHRRREYFVRKETEVRRVLVRRPKQAAGADNQGQSEKLCTLQQRADFRRIPTSPHPSVLVGYENDNDAMEDPTLEEDDEEVDRSSADDNVRSADAASAHEARFDAVAPADVHLHPPEHFPSRSQSFTTGVPAPREHGFPRRRQSDALPGWRSRGVIAGMLPAPPARRASTQSRRLSRRTNSAEGMQLGTARFPRHRRWMNRDSPPSKGGSPPNLSEQRAFPAMRACTEGRPRPRRRLHPETSPLDLPSSSTATNAAADERRDEKDAEEDAFEDVWEEETVEVEREYFRPVPFGRPFLLFFASFATQAQVRALVAAHGRRFWRRHIEAAEEGTTVDPNEPDPFTVRLMQTRGTPQQQLGEELGETCARFDAVIAQGPFSLALDWVDEAEFAPQAVACSSVTLDVVPRMDRWVQHGWVDRRPESTWSGKHVAPVAVTSSRGPNRCFRDAVLPHPWPPAPVWPDPGNVWVREEVTLAEEQEPEDDSSPEEGDGDDGSSKKEKGVEPTSGNGGASTELGPPGGRESLPSADLRWPVLRDPSVAKGLEMERARVSGAIRMTLARCFDAFTAVSDVSEWRCPSCSNKGGVQTHSLWGPRLPDLLVCHLTRFDVEPFPPYRRTKIKEFVDFPLNGLDVRPWCSGPSEMLAGDPSVAAATRAMGGNASANSNAGGRRGSVGALTDIPGDDSYLYDLYGVVNHSGSLSRGHYFAYVRLDHGTKWLELNDAIARIIRPSDVVTHRAYILFYRRRKFSPSNVINLTAHL